MQNRGVGVGRSAISSSLVNLHDLTLNIQEWIELINGTHLSGIVLIRPNDWHTTGTGNEQKASNTNIGDDNSNLDSRGGSNSKSWTDHDLARFGQSLERLELVLVSEKSVLGMRLDYVA